MAAIDRATHALRGVGIAFEHGPLADIRSMSTTRWNLPSRIRTQTTGVQPGSYSRFQKAIAASSPWIWPLSGLHFSVRRVR
jgi:hypothetical protein